MAPAACGEEDGQQSTANAALPIQRQQDGLYLFKWLCVAQVLMYLEAGAVPALLVQLSDSFSMDFITQGLLGGVVYLSLSAACPIAGLLFRKYDAQMVLGIAMTLNNICMLFFALTPVHIAGSCSKWVLIGARAAVGFTQAFLSIYGSFMHQTAVSSFISVCVRSMLGR